MSKLKKFKAKKVTKISEIAEKVKAGEDFFLEESDLSLQDDTYLVQFDLEKEDKEKRVKYEIKPGIFNIASGMAGLFLTPLEFRDNKLLEISDTTKTITEEFNKFFSKLDIYEKYGQEKRRAVLLHGPQGCGKTSSLTNMCNKLIEEDKGTVIINWNAATIRSGDVLDFFTSGSEYVKECTRVVFVIEDIGMGIEGYGGPKEVDRSLLQFLDGSGVSFKLPTFIVATTNYAHNLPANLVDRPGRFDKVIKIGFPNADDRILLLDFMMKGELSEEDKKTIKSKKCDDFSPAHLKEAFIRSKLEDKTLDQVIDELLSHKKSMSKGFEDRGNTGFL